MKSEKAQALVELILWIALVLLVVYVIWPWLNLTVVPWMVARFYGLWVGDMYSWAWLALIVLVLTLLGRRLH
jgi:hypothetical protein